VKLLELGRGNLVRVLLDKHNADVNTVDKDGGTPLSLAAAAGHLQLIVVLLDKEANTKSRNNKGRTPLLVAARAGNVRTVKLLLEHGADITSGDDQRSTAQSLATNAGHDLLGVSYNVLAVLMEHSYRQQVESVHDEFS
jgi:ankyrin repeat protein